MIEKARFIAIYVVGYAVGAIVQVSINKEVGVDNALCIIWGVSFVVAYLLFKHAGWIRSHKEAIQEIEIDRVLKEAKREMTKLKRKLLRYERKDGRRAHKLSTAYIERIIELRMFMCNLERLKRNSLSDITSTVNKCD